MLLKKKEHDKKRFIELINGLVDYEKNTDIIYSDDNNASLIFGNPSYTEMSQKVNK